MVELWAGEEAFAGPGAGVTWSAGLQTHSKQFVLNQQNQGEVSRAVSEILL